MPRISVILPFFNAENTFKRAIDSISNQSCADFECILIDNNSTDKSTNIAKQKVSEDDRFKLIYESKQGVMFASNAGSKAARGKYIARMDADDYAHVDRLKLQSEFLENHPGYGGVSGLVNYVAHHNNTDGMSRYVNWVNSICLYEEILLHRFVESPIVNPTAMWRKEVADSLGMYQQGDFPEDYELWLRWLGHGIKIAKINDVVLDWHDSDSRLTRTNEIYSTEAFYRIKTKYLSQWLKTNNPLFPKVAIWGASRISRKRVQLLEEHGIEIECFIDIKKSRQLDKTVIFYEDIPSPGQMFILVYVPQADAKEKIQYFLEKKGYKMGINYLLVS
ncbi:MAG: glycosyltransferase [Bacteroidales bacterium]|nr:glycosyltransferase [Bacteroidales bacterium]